MRSFTARFVFVGSLLAIAGCAGDETGGTGQIQQGVSGESFYVIAWNGGVPADASEVISDAGGELLDSLDQIGASLAVSSDPGFASRLDAAGSVSGVGEQRFQALPSSDIEGEVESGTPPTPGAFDFYQWNIRRIGVEEAWETTTGSHDTVVAVLDTGVAWNHPDLAPNVVFAACASVLAPCQAYPSFSSHGTHVAGTVAASSGYGVVGVGPDLGIASYNVFEEVPGYGVVAFDWPIFVSLIDAAERGFPVANLSLGGYVVRPASQEDVAAWTLWNRVVNYVRGEGLTIVAAAGNEDFDLNGPVSHIPSDLPSVISVGATGIGPDPFYPQEDPYDVRAFYSNTGAALTLSAPGGDLGPEDTLYPAHWYLIFSTYVFYPDNEFGVPVDPTCSATASCPVGWAWMGGTSMASPHVAGVAGLLADEYPGLSANQRDVVLKRTAESVGSRQEFGHGIVDAAAALDIRGRR